MNRNVLIALSLVVLLGAFGGGAWLYRARQAGVAADAAEAAQAQVFSPARAVHLGDPSARVVLVEFFDPACDTCAQFAPVLKDMIEQSNGKVQLVERYAPFHAGSEPVVAVLEAARRQNRYWETLDLLFSTQSTWVDQNGANIDQVWTVLGKTDLDQDRLHTDAKDPAIAAIIQQDLKDAKTVGVKLTPEFYVDGKPLPTWGLRQLQDLVASELNAKY